MTMTRDEARAQVRAMTFQEYNATASPELVALLRAAQVPVAQGAPYRALEWYERFEAAGYWGPGAFTPAMQAELSRWREENEPRRKEPRVCGWSDFADRGDLKGWESMYAAGKFGASICGYGGCASVGPPDAPWACSGSCLNEWRKRNGKPEGAVTGTSAPSYTVKKAQPTPAPGQVWRIVGGDGTAYTVARRSADGLVWEITKDGKGGYGMADVDVRDGHWEYVGPAPLPMPPEPHRAKPRVPLVGEVWKRVRYGNGNPMQAGKEFEVIRINTDGGPVLTGQWPWSLDLFLEQWERVSPPARAPEANPTTPPIPKVGEWYRCTRRLIEGHVDVGSQWRVVPSPGPVGQQIDMASGEVSRRPRIIVPPSEFAGSFERCPPPPCPSSIKDPTPLKETARVYVDNGWTEYD